MILRPFGGSCGMTLDPLRGVPVEGCGKHRVSPVVRSTHASTHYVCAF